MVNLNFIPEERKREIELAEENARKVNERAEGKHTDSNEEVHSKDECLQMYDRGYVSNGIKFELVRCRKCGNEKEAAVSSDFYQTKVCANCMRKQRSTRTVVEL